MIWLKTFLVGRIMEKKAAAEIGAELITGTVPMITRWCAGDRKPWTAENGRPLDKIYSAFLSIHSVLNLE